MTMLFYCANMSLQLNERTYKLTEKQANALALNPDTKKAVAVLQKFAEAEATLKMLEAQKKEAEKMILEAMVNNGVQKVSGDWGYITLATRKTFKQTGDVQPKFLKKALDTTKVNAHYTLKGELPAGVELNETQYLTKKIK